MTLNAYDPVDYQDGEAYDQWVTARARDFLDGLWTWEDFDDDNHADPRVRADLEREIDAVRYLLKAGHLSQYQLDAIDA